MNKVADPVKRKAGECFVWAETRKSIKRTRDFPRVRHAKKKQKVFPKFQGLSSRDLNERAPEKMFSQRGLQKHPVNKWNEREVCRWLKHKGLGKLWRNFHGRQRFYVFFVRSPRLSKLQTNNLRKIAKGKIQHRWNIWLFFFLLLLEGKKVDGKILLQITSQYLGEYLLQCKVWHNYSFK